MSISLPAFDYQRLDAFKVARETLRLGDTLARRLPHGYATLQDQLRRALLSAYLGIAEASSRQGADRLCRFRCARGEVCEAAAALEGVLVLNLAPEGRNPGAAGVARPLVCHAHTARTHGRFVRYIRALRSAWARAVA